MKHPLAEQAAASAVQADLPQNLAEARWTLAQRALFRFGVAYIFLQTFPGPFDPLDLRRGFWSLWTEPVAWITAHALGPSRVVHRAPNGGDSLRDWIASACFLVVAATAAAVWSLVDRRTQGYTKFADFALGYLRFTLAGIVLGYGVIKIFAGQFPRPEASFLIRPLGQSTPMTLLWNTMGVSPLYQAFGGGVETAGALLLFFRRTALLGALIVAGAMANVFALNLGYDIHVKQSSLHLLIYALVIVAVHRRRLVAFFFANRNAAPAPERARLTPRWLDRASQIAAYAFAALLVVVTVRESRALAAANTAPPPPWGGLFEVTSFAIDGREVPPLFGDHDRWRWVTLYVGAIVVQLGDDEQEVWLAERDEKQRTMRLTLDDRRSFAEPLRAEPCEVRYDDRDPDALALEGELRGRHVVARLRRARPTFRLERPTGHLIDDGTFQR